MDRRPTLLFRARHGRSHRPLEPKQVLDLPIDGISTYTPIYGIYENGVPKRVAIFNYANDPSGGNDVQAVISLSDPVTGAATTPASVKVKYLAAASVVQKGNFTWAGQVRPDLCPFTLPHHPFKSSIPE